MKKSHQHAILLAVVAGMLLTARAQDTNDQAQFPAILQQPVDACLPIGGTASFSVTAANVTAYQWLFNGNPLDGETNDTLTVANLGVANVGYYSVSVINGSEVVPSRSALLNVYTSATTAVTTVTTAASPLLSAATMKASSALSVGNALGSLDDMNGGGLVVVFGLPVLTMGGGGSCPGKYAGYVIFTKTASQGWGWSPSTNTTVYTATDTNSTITKVQYGGDYGDSGCAQTSVTFSSPAPSPVYRFAIYFPPGSQVPTNAYPITLSGFNP